MSKGYPSPTAALAAIVECLVDVCDRVHVGSLGTGADVSCCPGCLLRVETAGLRVPDGKPRSMVNMPKCQGLILDVVVTYTECFKSVTNSGKTPPIADLTAGGIAVITSW